VRRLGALISAVEQLLAFSLQSEQIDIDDLGSCISNEVMSRPCHLRQGRS